MQQRWWWRRLKYRSFAKEHIYIIHARTHALQLFSQHRNIESSFLTGEIPQPNLLSHASMPSIDLYATHSTLIIKKTRQKEKKIDQPIIIICVYTRPGFKFICLFFFLASISVEMWSDSAVSFDLLIDKTSACVFLLAPQKIQRTGLEYTTRSLQSQ